MRKGDFRSSFEKLDRRWLVTYSDLHKELILHKKLIPINEEKLDKTTYDIARRVINHYLEVIGRLKDFLSGDEYEMHRKRASELEASFEALAVKNGIDIQKPSGVGVR